MRSYKNNKNPIVEKRAKIFKSLKIAKISKILKIAKKIQNLKNDQISKS